MKKPPQAVKTEHQRSRKKVDSITIDAAIQSIDALETPTPQAAKVFSLLKSWLGDTSGYDEATLPQLERALDKERDRAGARRLFDE